MYLSNIFIVNIMDEAHALVRILHVRSCWFESNLDNSLFELIFKIMSIV